MPGLCDRKRIKPVVTGGPVMERLQIPKRLMQTLRRRAEELGVTPEEFLIELMVDAVDPGERPQAYIDAAREMLEQAKKSSDQETLDRLQRRYGERRLSQ
jgi:hypothetical protein